MSKKDDLKILGLKEKATKEEIKKAYKKLAMKHHPDKVKTQKAKQKAEQKMAEINKAYHNLMEDKYNEFESGYADNSEFFNQYKSNYQNNNFNDAFEGFFNNNKKGRNEDYFENMEDIFSSVFNRTKKKQYKIKITFKQAVCGSVIQCNITNTKKIKVEILPGTKSDDIVYSSDDFIITVYVENDNEYKFYNEYDLIKDLHIDLKTALIGGNKLVSTLFGDVYATIKACSLKNGSKLKIKGKGIKKNNKQGDLYCNIIIDMPTKLTEQQTKIINKYF